MKGFGTVLGALLAPVIIAALTVLVGAILHGSELALAVLIVLLVVGKNW